MRNKKKLFLVDCLKSVIQYRFQYISILQFNNLCTDPAIIKFQYIEKYAKLVLKN